MRARRVGRWGIACALLAAAVGPQPAPSLPPASQVTDISSLAGAGSSGL